ncbi:arylamine N-acetyltransferase, pineal gland isozyme NAT-3-like [Ambystoma mexicanum]|uniref:arylamine N-acetyltransferase, pineal gland isozyme NAT-3-like n=1 Tax=Ambystoma mexicanum TaxID=8296 RepID=UPI0037E76EFC
MNKLEYFKRICYRGSTEKANMDTLTAIFQHHIKAIPFENASGYCGETVFLDFEAIFEKLVMKKRGGCCWEHNFLFYWIIKEMGYAVTLIGGNFYIPELEIYSINISHPMLTVVVDGTTYLLDAGAGLGYQMWQPIEVVSGMVDHQIPGTFCLTEKRGLWYLDKTERYQHNPSMQNSGTEGEETCIHILFFTLKPRSMGFFQPVCTYLQSCEDFILSSNLLCSIQLPGGYFGLFNNKLTKVTYNFKENMDLIEVIILKDEEFEKALVEKITINLENNFFFVKKERKKSHLV